MGLVTLVKLEILCVCWIRNNNKDLVSNYYWIIGWI